MHYDYDEYLEAVKAFRQYKKTIYYKHPWPPPDPILGEHIPDVEAIQEDLDPEPVDHAEETDMDQT